MIGFVNLLFSKPVHNLVYVNFDNIQMIMMMMMILKCTIYLMFFSLLISGMFNYC